MRSQMQKDTRIYRRFDDEDLRNKNSKNYIHEFEYNEGGNVYNPPEFNNREERSNTNRNFVVDDNAFAAVGKNILIELDRVTSMITNEREKSVTIALQLQKIMSIDELVNFNHALNVRIRNSKHSHHDLTQIEALLYRCERTFGEELRMLILPKGSKSPTSRPSTERRAIATPSPLKHNLHRFNNPAKTDIDLTNHIIYDIEDISIVKEGSSFSYDDTKEDNVYSNLTIPAFPTASSSCDDTDASAVYTIELEDIKKKGMSSSFSEPSNDRGSPNKVRFHSNTKDSSFQQQNIATPTKKSKRQSFGNRKSIEVVSPATVPENFMFEARMGDELFMVVVVSL